MQPFYRLRFDAVDKVMQSQIGDQDGTIKT